MHYKKLETENIKLHLTVNYTISILMLTQTFP